MKQIDVLLKQNLIHKGTFITIFVKFVHLITNEYFGMNDIDVKRGGGADRCGRF